jgi:hypothetical protein
MLVPTRKDVSGAIAFAGQEFLRNMGISTFRSRGNVSNIW